MAGQAQSDVFGCFSVSAVVNFTHAGLFARRENAQLNATANPVNGSSQMWERSHWLINKLN